ncbi:energy-coupling factor transporter ATPase [Beduini massiliensis]|uniref:energy-coupling factor transporter ATPase n=1 Tax=Beduini massiliensis TaxID=1585974 RepID=UPI00059AB3A4|nr:energy-coupling factor transporter ATPase [Beduini massiliensis]
MSIKFEQVSHTYSKNTPFQYIALKDVDLAIEKGSFTAIIGHTGSGKSTLIQHINGLILPTSGIVTVNDFVVDANNLPKVLRPLRQMAGLVFQFPEYQLFEDSVEKDIIFGPKNFGVDEETAKQKAKEALAMVKMDESYLEKSPFDLSGGQKRRIAIAGILVMEPDILVLDEPTAGLDPQGAKEMMELFKALNDQGKTVIIVTHDMNQVLNYCDHAVVMNKGEIIKTGTVEEIFKDPEYLETLSIDLPIMTHFIHELNKNGFHIDPSIKDLDTLIKAIGGK